jgi:hypothetical protein
MVMMTKKVEMELHHKIKNFHDIGMANPFEPVKGVKRAIKEIENYEFEKNLYPKTLIAPLLAKVEEGGRQHPRCIFLPE